MGKVFLGRRDGPGDGPDQVAIKEPHEATAADRETFLREARIAQRVKHPNVVETLEVVEEGGRLFHVMGLVEGESLSGLAKAAQEAGRSIPPPVALRLLLDLLAGLEAIHVAGIVHRDVSPQNVLVGLDGIARVADFGIAKSSTHFTETGAGFKGKLLYVSPEQVDGASVTTASDVYSAAVVGWELFAGEPLFRGDSQSAILARVLAGRVRSLSRLVPDIDPQLDAALLSALKKAPAERPPSTGALAVALTGSSMPPASHAEVGAFVESLVGDLVRRRLTNGAPPLIPDPAMRMRTVRLPPSTGPRPKPPARNGTFTWAAAIVLLVLLLVLVSATRPRTETARVPSPPAPSTPTRSPTSAQEELPPNDVPVRAAEPPSAAAPVPASSSPSLPPRARPARAPVGPSPKPDCKQKYTLDGQGHMIFKKECF